MWVIMISVVLCWLCSENSRFMIVLLLVLFRLLVGLFVKRIFGCGVIVWVSVICCCLLFDSWLG